ncbi:hypothetical protein ES319_D11G090800v1 [Gossypium barbadense]|uniref:PAP-associated domain-containing protein n=1 Tax=Gossypium barbadense TaxID=3634 RepID=A0A5J5P8T5_GOSBA|nr:hypothetical protein ES319_D11G090800v1 [Gossypium barbadense]
MNGSGGDAPPPLTANGGEFLLSLLQKPQSHHPPQQSPLPPGVAPMTVPQPQAQSLAIDPAVQAVGPTLPFSPSWSPNGRDLPSPWPHNLSPPFYPNLIGFRQNPWFSPGNQIAFNQEALVDDLRRIGISRIDSNNNHVIPNLTQLKHREQKLVFGSFPSDIQTLPKPDGVLQNSNLNFSNQQSNSRLNANPNSSPYFFQRRNSDERGKQQQHDGNCRSTPSAETPRPPPGFSGQPRRGGGSRDFGKNTRHVAHSVNKLKAELGHLSYDNETRLRGQLDHPVPPAGSNPQSVSVTEIEGPLLELHMDGGANGFSRRDKPRREDGGEVDEIEEKFVEPLLVEDESDDKNDKKRHHREKEYRKDNRGQRLLSQRERMLKRRTDCHSDILRYVLMCIHFLQQRRPAILPCLQGMETTFSVTVDDVECAYFDKVENLCNFGSSNQETIAQLVWAFFNYWAYIHDYANSVISVRTGSLISKGEKDWTRRIDNDRHLICIEDPFVVSHDLGQVVDKFSIKVLRAEFERAADVMHYDPNPWITLFEPYVLE